MVVPVYNQHMTVLCPVCVHPDTVALSVRTSQVLTLNSYSFHTVVSRYIGLHLIMPPQYVKRFPHFQPHAKSFTLTSLKFSHGKDLTFHHHLRYTRVVKLKNFIIKNLFLVTVNQ